MSSTPRHQCLDINNLILMLRHQHLDINTLTLFKLDERSLPVSASNSERKATKAPETFENFGIGVQWISKFQSQGNKRMVWRKYTFFLALPVIITICDVFSSGVDTLKWFCKVHLPTNQDNNADDDDYGVCAIFKQSTPPWQAPGENREPWKVLPPGWQNKI